MLSNRRFIVLSAVSALVMEYINRTRQTILEDMDTTRDVDYDHNILGYHFRKEHEYIW